MEKCGGKQVNENKNAFKFAELTWQVSGCQSPRGQRHREILIPRLFLVTQNEIHQQ